MKANEKPFEAVGLTHDMYLAYCKVTKKPHYKKQSKIDFFNDYYRKQLINGEHGLYLKGELIYAKNQD